MRNKHLLNSILQNTSCPKGFWGRMILWGMNRFHASLARRGMKQVNWQPQWTVLDIGCGGGANLNRLLKQCPQGKWSSSRRAFPSTRTARRKRIRA